MFENEKASLHPVMNKTMPLKVYNFMVYSAGVASASRIVFL